MVIYVTTQGAQISKEGKHLLVKKDSTIFHTLFPERVDQLVLFGKVELTHSAICQIFRHEIDTVFLSKNGRYLGRLALPEANNVFLRKRQYSSVDDKVFALRFAKQVVVGKLKNMATLLYRIKRSRKEKEVADLAKQIQLLIPRAEEAGDLDSLRGYEGRGTAIFFSGFRYGFIEDMGFQKRVRRPPTDPVNSVLSLVYTFLMNRVYSAVRLAQLDPFAGYLHSIEYSRYSLVLDLMEEFRTIIGDTLVLSLFNLKMLSAGDFTFNEPDEVKYDARDQKPDVTADPLGRMEPIEIATATSDLPDQRLENKEEESQVHTRQASVKLCPGALATVIEAFEKKVNATFFHSRADNEMSYQDAMIFQAREFRRVIEGDIAAYQPLLLR